MAAPRVSSGGETARTKSASPALRALLACAFAVMVGYGIALPVLLLYAEQLVGTDAQDVALHAGLLHRTGLRGARPYRGGRIRLVLAAGVAAQLGVALFEARFTVYARRVLDGRPAVIGAAFALCGTAMALTQALAVPHVDAAPRSLFATGLALQGLGFVLLAALTTTAGALASISMMGVGVSMFVPRLAVVASREATTDVGAALGTNSAAQSLGQIAGPLLGMSLVSWPPDAPFLGGVGGRSPHRRGVRLPVAVLLSRCAGRLAARAARGEARANDDHVELHHRLFLASEGRVRACWSGSGPGLAIALTRSDEP